MDEVKDIPLSQLALEIAASQVGVEEHPRGSNAGKEVNQYLHSVGLSYGYPWCMAFVYWCVDQACKKKGISNPLIRTGGVMHQYDNVDLRKLPKTSSAIKPGDIFIMQFAHGTGHTGFVREVHNGIVKTIEGNTNEDGSREGYAVALRERPISSFKGFIQL